MLASTEPPLLSYVVLPYKGTGVTSLPLRREEIGWSVQMPVFQKYTVSKYFPSSQIHISISFSSRWAFSARGRLLTLEISLPLFISCLTKRCIFSGVLASWDCCNKFPQIWWFEATKTYSLSSGGQRSEFKVATWIRQGHTPSRGPGGQAIPPLSPASGAGAVPGLQPHRSPPCLPFTWPSPPVSSPQQVSLKDFRYWIRGPPWILQDYVLTQDL